MKEEKPMEETEKSNQRDKKKIEWCNGRKDESYFRKGAYVPITLSENKTPLSVRTLSPVVPVP